MLIRKFILKVINNERKNFSDHSSMQRTEIVDSSELVTAKFLIYLFI